MNEDDLALRNLTYARFVDLGRAPTAAEVAVAGGRDRAEVTAGWERLHAEHALAFSSIRDRRLRARSGDLDQSWPGGPELPVLISPRSRGHPAWAGRMLWLKRNRLAGS